MELLFVGDVYMMKKVSREIRMKLNTHPLEVKMIPR